MKKIIYFTLVLTLIYSCKEEKKNENKLQNKITIEIFDNHRFSKIGDICMEVESVDKSTSKYYLENGTALIYVLIPENGSLEEAGNSNNKIIELISKGGNIHNNQIDVVPVLIKGLKKTSSRNSGIKFNLKLEVEKCPKISGDDFEKHKNSEVSGHP